MKKLIIPAIMVALISFTACNSSSNKSNETDQYACVMHPEVVGKKGSKCSKCGMKLTEPVVSKETKSNSTGTTEIETQSKFTTTEIVNSYLVLKNALTKDDSKAAATAGKALFDAFNKVDANDMEMKKMFLEIADNAKEHAEHIGDNAGKIEHQREHFVLLSKDIIDLVKMFGSSQKLYEDYCPMANDGKGAIWISEVKEIKNPFLGAKMPTCGSVKAEY